MELTDYEKDIIARTILGEAMNQGLDGMEAVAHVIKNRAESGSYPSNPADVALQRGQFSAWNGKTGYAGGSGANDLVNIGSGKYYNQALQAIDNVFSGADPDNTGEALNYWSPSGMPGGKDPRWAKGKNNRVTVGDHVFLARGPVASDAEFDPLPAPTPLKPTGFSIGGALGGIGNGILGAFGNAKDKAIQIATVDAPKYGKNFAGAVEKDIRANPGNFLTGVINQSGLGGLFNMIGSMGGNLLSGFGESKDQRMANMAAKSAANIEAAKSTGARPITYGFSLATPGDGRPSVNGIDMAFMPESVQRSSRWNTGY